MDANCLFCRIVAGELPADVIVADAEGIVIRDINPQAPVHLVALPRRHVANVGTLALDQDGLLAVFRLAVTAADKMGLPEHGYRLVVNTGEDGGQTVEHVHVHVLGGRPMGWPPG